MDYWSEYAQYLRRPYQVQQAAVDFFHSQFHSEEFAGIHWRYDTYDWNDMCSDNRPDSAKALNGKLCELSSRLENGDKELLKSMSSNLHERLTNLSISHAYIAAPPQINDTIALFKEEIPSLFTIDDLRHWIKTKKPQYINLLESNYLLSHLEQEIMFLSKKYFASPLSSWSQTVYVDRMAKGITSDESILDVFLPGVDGLPQLTWLFPEGDQGSQLKKKH